MDAKKNPPPARWQYHVEKVNVALHPMRLTQLGLDGWEMCGCTMAREVEVVCYFKRPLPPAN